MSRSYSDDQVRLVVKLQQLIDGRTDNYEMGYLAHQLTLIAKNDKKCGDRWISLFVEIDGNPAELLKINTLTMDDPVVLYEVITSTIYHYFP